MRQVALASLLTVACGMTPAHLQALTLAFHVGDVYEYSLHMVLNQDVTQGTMSAIPQFGDLTAREKVTVVSIDAKGAADLTVQLFNVVVKEDTASGTGAAAPSRPTQNVRIAADGRMISLSGTSTWPGDFPFGASLGGNLFTAVLPPHAVKPGDTWSNDYDEALPFNFQPFHLATKSKYLRDESVQGVNAAVVQTTTDISADFRQDTTHQTRGTASSDVITWIDPGTRRILRSHMSAKMDAALTYENPSVTAGSIVTVLKATETADLLPLKG